MNERVKDFILRRRLDPEMQLNEPLRNGIDVFEQANEVVVQLAEAHVERLCHEVPWPVMHDMYNRNYEYCCAALNCFLTGHFPSSEALCRTAVEGAVNLHYVSLGDSMGKQIAYFKSYISQEREQNKKWRNSVEASELSIEEKTEHIRNILSKEGALGSYEEMLRTSLSLDGVDYDAQTPKWPPAFERFKEIGDELGYRTVYAALCSQAHNDAEDILNGIHSRVTTGVDGLDQAMAVQQYSFSLYMVLTTIRYHTNAAAKYLSRFDVDVRQLAAVQKKIESAIIQVSQNMMRLVSEKITLSS